MRGLHLAAALLAAGLAAAAMPAWANPNDGPAPEEALADPALESRAMSLAREIRCVVCENEPVALSSAEIAVDMRQAIRERVAAGDSDDQVRAYFASRYGEFVLLRPRVSGETLVLWGAPLLLLALGGGFLLLRARRPAAGGGGAEPRMDPAEEAAARAALARHAPPAKPESR